MNKNKLITLQRKTEDANARHVVAIRMNVGDDASVSDVQVNEILFLEGHVGVPVDATHHWESADELVQAVREMYLGVDDPRLPEDVQAWPVGKREDYVSNFNDAIYWYWKDYDDDYDVNEPLHVNIARYADKQARDYVANHAAVYGEGDSAPATQGTKQTKMSMDGAVRVRNEYVGYMEADKIRESSSGGYDVPVQIIQGGWSLNGEYFTQESLNDIARLLSNKVPGYFRHGDNDRDARDWAMVIEDAQIEKDTVQGNAHIFQYPHGEALKERIDYVVENNANHLFGVSIDGWARVEEGEVDGREGIIIRNMVAMNSVDVVMVPAANGRWTKTTQSVRKDGHPTNRKQENNKMDLETLRKEHPDLVSVLVEEGRREMQDKVDEVTKQLEEAAEQAKVKEAEYEGQIVDLKAKVQEYEDKEKAAQFRERVEKLIADTLDETVVTESFRESLLKLGEDKWEVIEGLVNDRKEVAAAKGPENMGPVKKTEDKQPDTSEEDRKQLFLANLK